MKMVSTDDFGYPEFDKNGKMELTNTTDLHPNMLQNITVYKLKPGQVFRECFDTQEMAIVLIEGDVTFEWTDEKIHAKRKSCINDGAYCLHVSKGISVSVTASAESEILVQSTENERDFDAKMYTPKNCQEEVFGEGQFEGKARRAVRTFFDYPSAPYSNMVCGEIIIPQGGWSSYPPHEHPQPEVYYYRFEHPTGFGTCFINDDAYKIQDHSFAAIPGGKYHPQVNAPGYAMYYMWMIRHFDGYPWTERNFDPDHAWLLDT